MKKELFVFNFKGINYYTCKGGLIVNLTHDNVNINNYNDVYDIDCFTVCEKIESYEDFKNIVIDCIACDNLNSIVYNDLKKVTDKTNIIIKNIGRMAMNRENNILANYSHLEIKGNTIKFYDNDNYCFTVDYRQNSNIGRIVG